MLVPVVAVPVVLDLLRRAGGDPGLAGRHTLPLGLADGGALGVLIIVLRHTPAVPASRAVDTPNAGVPGSRGAAPADGVAARAPAQGSPGVRGGGSGTGLSRCRAPSPRARRRPRREDVGVTERLAADLVVERLRAWGVPRVFGYSGDGITAVMGALRRAGEPEFVQPRHEEAAAFMAVGHAKYGGGVGVALSTQGPGAVHLLTGPCDAKLDGVPVVAIMGQQERSVLGAEYQQEVDLLTLAKDVAAQFAQTVTTAEQLPLVLDRAFRTALATRSPAVVVLPHDVQQLPAPEPEQSHGVVVTAPAWRPGRLLPHDEDLRAAADVLNAGRKVALLVGQGARSAGDEVLAVADRLRARRGTRPPGTTELGAHT